MEQAPDDSLRFNDLIHASTRIRDERVLQSALGVVGDLSQPRQIRYGAISVLWHYVLTGLKAVFGTALLKLDPPRVIVGVGGHNLQPTIGGQTVPGDPRQRLIARLGPLAETTADDPYVWMSIRETIQEFRVIRRDRRRP